MARAGVTFVDVEKAAAELVEKGQEPTVDRVREVIGSGSKSTLGPLLKKWRASQEGATNTKLPPNLLQAVNSLYEQLQSSADRRITEANEVLAVERTSFEEKLKEETQKAAAQAQAFEALQEKYTQLNNQYEAQTARLHQREVELASANTRIDQLTTQRDSQHQTLESLQQEKQAVREQLEHFQQHTALERQAERDQVAKIQGDFQARLSKSEETAEKYEQAATQYKNQLIEAESSLVVWQERSAELTKKVEDERQEFRKLQAKRASLEEQYNAVVLAQQSSAQEVKHLKQQVGFLVSSTETQSASLTKNEALITSLRQTIKHLTDDKLKLSKEYALLQGKLASISHKLNE